MCNHFIVILLDDITYTKTLILTPKHDKLQFGLHSFAIWMWCLHLYICLFVANIIRSIFLDLIIFRVTSKQHWPKLFEIHPEILRDEQLKHFPINICIHKLEEEIGKWSFRIERKAKLRQRHLCLLQFTHLRRDISLIQTSFSIYKKIWRVFFRCSCQLPYFALFNLDLSISVDILAFMQRTVKNEFHSLYA